MKYLCHYTKSENAHEIIGNMTLNFGKLINSNDPIEVKKVSSFLPYLDLEEQNKEENRTIKSANEYLKNILHFLCFSDGEIKNISYLPGIDLDGYEVEIENDVINPEILEKFSQRPPYYLPRMWAQYGDNHKGVCFIFNKQELIKQVKEQVNSFFNIKCKRIKYSDFLKNDTLMYQGGSHLYSYLDIKKTPEEFIQDGLKSDSDLNYFTKDIDWKGEREYRILIWNTLQNNDFADRKIMIDNKSLIGVVMGLKNDDFKLVKMTREKKIKNIFQLRYECNFIGLYPISRDML